MNEATETIRKAANELTDGQKDAADALVASLTHLAEVVKTSHDVSPDVTSAADAIAAVRAAAEGLEGLGALVPALRDALDTVVSAAETAADSVSELVLRPINKDTPLREVLRLYKRADPDDADLKAIKMSTTTARVKLQAWWLTRNSSPADAVAMLGTGDAAEAARAFAGTLDDLCERLGLPDRTSCCHASPNCCCVLLLFHSPSTCCRVSTFCFIFFQANHWRTQQLPV